VIVAGRSCLPEVCGDAARFVDPDDVESFSSVIAESLVDADWRVEAVQRGFRRVRQFTWAGCVTGTISVYAKATREVS
jgi:glycosyltransferase involved in cell wall biosynthesis